MDRQRDPHKVPRVPAHSTSSFGTSTPSSQACSCIPLEAQTRTKPRHTTADAPLTKPICVSSAPTSRALLHLVRIRPLRSQAIIPTTTTTTTRTKEDQLVPFRSRVQTTRALRWCTVVGVTAASLSAHSGATSRITSPTRMESHKPAKIRRWSHAAGRVARLSCSTFPSMSSARTCSASIVFAAARSAGRTHVDGTSIAGHAKRCRLMSRVGSKEDAPQ
jgi:hypothetical protein